MIGLIHWFGTIPAKQQSLLPYQREVLKKLREIEAGKVVMFHPRGCGIATLHRIIREMRGETESPR